VNLKRILRQGRTLNLASGTVFLGLAFLFLRLEIVGIVLMAASMIALIAVYHQSEIAFWRSQYEWWDDEEWDAWEEGNT
jgi:hypothetical protein